MNTLETLYMLTDESLKNLIKGCEIVQKNATKVRQAKKELIQLRSNVDYEFKKLDRETNPEEYFKFKFYERGCEIIYSNNFYDSEKKQWYKKQGKRIYAIKYYNCDSRLFKKETEPINEYNNKIYGQYETLEEAEKKFKMAVIDILSQSGVMGLNPLDFAILN